MRDFAFCLPAKVGVDHITGITDCVSRLGTSTLIERITVYDDHFTVEFKSGIEVDVEL